MHFCSEKACKPKLWYPRMFPSAMRKGSFLNKLYPMEHPHIFFLNLSSLTPHSPTEDLLKTLTTLWTHQYAWVLEAGLLFLTHLLDPKTISIPLPIHFHELTLFSKSVYQGKTFGFRELSNREIGGKNLVQRVERQFHHKLCLFDQLFACNWLYSTTQVISSPFCFFDRS